MKLMPQHANPSFTQTVDGIVAAGKQLRRHSGPLSRIGEQLVFAIEALHCCLRCVAADTMRLHRQFAFIFRQGRLLFRHQIARELI